MKRPQTIAEALRRLNDRELLEMLPYIRNENGDRVSLAELKQILKEETKEVRRSWAIW